MRPVGVEFFHVDEGTYMTKLIIDFRNFTNAPKNWITAKCFSSVCTRFPEDGLTRAEKFCCNYVLLTSFVIDGYLLVSL